MAHIVCTEKYLKTINLITTGNSQFFLLRISRILKKYVFKYLIIIHYMEFHFAKGKLFFFNYNQPLFTGNLLSR